MKFSLTREEAERLSRTIDWVLAATLPGEEERNSLIQISSKLKICLKANETQSKIELEIE